jgi:hypothetical protein
MKEIFVDKEALRRIWVEWKTVILTAAGVFITISSLYWLPLILEQLPQYQGNPAEIQKMTEQISNIFWFIVFIYAAQVIFGNRKKRIEAKKKAEQEKLAAAAASETPSAPDSADPKS